MVWQFICMALLVLVSAFFSGSEIAFASANKLRIEKNAEKGDTKAKYAQYIVNHYTSSVSTILLGNNLVNIAASVLGTVIATELIRSENAAQTVATISVTLALLIFGEIFPKIFCAEFADKLVYLCALPLRIAMIICYPVIKLVDVCISKMSVIWTPKTTAPTVTAEELVTIVDEMQEEGGFTEEEGDLIKSAIEFNELNVKEILTPRVDTLAWDINDGVENLIADKELLSYSRFPVYEDSLDKVIGILSTRDLVRAYFKTGQDTDIRKLLTPPMFVHMTRDISSVLPEMRKSGTEMAIVLDEFGGTLGIITVEDIVEQIIGEIYDEGDEIEVDVVDRGNCFEIDGGMNIHEFLEEMSIDDSDFETEYTTVGGWATEVLDKIPEEGDRFEYKNVSVVVSEVSANRVEKLTVTVNEETEEE